LFATWGFALESNLSLSWLYLLVFIQFNSIAVANKEVKKRNKPSIIKNLAGLTTLHSLRAYLKILYAVAPEKANKEAVKVFGTPFNQKVRQWEKQVLEESRKVRIGFEGLDITLYRWGNSPKKVLCVHGWEGNGGNFGAYKELLLAKGYEIIAFDGPAHHTSGGKFTNLFQFSRLVFQLINQERPLLIMAHSFGSGASVLALHDHPEVKVQKLVLFSSQDQLEEPVAVFTTLMKFSERSSMRLKKHMEGRFKRRFEEVAIGKMMRKIDADIMLIHEKNDKVLPYHNAIQIKEKNPGIELLTTTHTGHYRMLWDESIKKEVERFV
jgi:pimeloyl-ACP methyl ester carboxylesterase